MRSALFASSGSDASLTSTEANGVNGTIHQSCQAKQIPKIAYRSQVPTELWSRTMISTNSSSSAITAICSRGKSRARTHQISERDSGKAVITPSSSVATRQARKMTLTGLVVECRFDISYR